MKQILILLLVSLTFVSANTFAQADTTLTPHEFAKYRCGAPGETLYFLGRGRVHLAKRGQGAQHLFDFLGLDISTCIESADGSLVISSRELGYYLHKGTLEPMDTWSPSAEIPSMPVVHISNPLLQFPLPPRIPVRAQGSYQVVTLEIPAVFPNPVFGQEEFGPYLPYPTIEYLSSYQFFLNTLAASPKEPDSVFLEYTEVGDPRPWMMPGGYDHMTIRVTAHRIHEFSALPTFLRKEIEERLPLYREALPCLLPHQPTNSFFSFIEDFDAFLSGEKFPRPVSADIRCPSE